MKWKRWFKGKMELVNLQMRKLELEALYSLIHDRDSFIGSLDRFSIKGKRCHINIWVAALKLKFRLCINASIDFLNE